MKVRHVKHKDIDKVRWDQCILNSNPSLVYANSWYLDVVSPGWQALVVDDYHAVFPLPVKRKLGLTFCHQPLFTQQLGLFSADLNNKAISLVLTGIPRFILSLRLFLNHGNNIRLNSYFSKRLNHIIPLSDPETINAGYNQNTRRNVKRALSNNLEIRTKLDIDVFVDFKKETSVVALPDKAWARMKKLIGVILKHNSGEFLAAYKGGILVSAVFLSDYNGRLTYLFSANSELGKEERASFLLVNHLLTTNAGTGKILDFEGSMDENISRFFKGFGAVEEVYYEFQKGIMF